LTRPGARTKLFPVDKISRETELDPNYVTGFVEAAGSFTYLRSGSDGQVFTLVFGLKLPTEERQLLDDVARYFGVGRIYDVKAAAPARPSSYFRVSRQEDLEIVVEHFEKHPLRGAKRAAFEAWREMVRLKKDNFRHPPVDALVALAARLSSTSRRRRER
jgi:hypothetical protein